MVTLLPGFLAGALHVFSGPDHLAAIAPLAVGGKVRASSVGLRWGIGHAVGVSCLGLAALAFRPILPIEIFSSWSERLVGALLIGVGLWLIRKVFRGHLHYHEHSHDGVRHRHIHFHASQGHTSRHSHSHAAFAIGIIHGFAGSAHLFFLLPALALPTKAMALMYVVAFGIGTIVAMIIFSTLVGLTAQRFSRFGERAYARLLYGFSFTAIAVGLVWLLV